MGANRPKQFLDLQGKPILIHTLQNLHTACPEAAFTVVLPEDQHNTWLQLCREHACTIQHQVVKGGNTRTESVRNGLATISAKGFIAIHDGVRPFVKSTFVQRLFHEAAQHGNAIPACGVRESLRQINGASSKAVDRSSFVTVQTPQVFDAAKLKEAFAQMDDASFTDDATVFEAAGHSIHLSEGDPDNLKITLPADLVWAEAIADTFS